MIRASQPPPNPAHPHAFQKYFFDDAVEVLYIINGTKQIDLLLTIE